MPILRRDIGKRDDVGSFGNGASSENSPVTGRFPSVGGAGIGIHLNSVDVNLEISTIVRRVRALIITEGLVRKGEVSVVLQGGSHGQSAVASIGRAGGRYSAEGQVASCQYHSRIRSIGAWLGRVFPRRRAVSERDTLARVLLGKIRQRTAPVSNERMRKALARIASD